MGVIITLANKKGGVGKSLIAVNLALLLAKQKKKVLVIDMDGQATTTNYFTEDINKGIFDSMVGLEPIESIIIPIMECLDIAPATPKLNVLDMYFDSYGITVGQESVLKAILEPVKEKYDFILIDSAGVLDLSTKNALISSDFAIIPTICNGTSLSATDNILNFCDQIKRLNPDFRVLGILFNRYTDRSAIAKDTFKAFEEVAANHHTKIFKSTLRNASILENSYTNSEDWTSRNLPIKSDFDNFIKELNNELNSKGGK